jgi:hypothetical protein
MDAIMPMFSRTSSASLKKKGFPETLETLFFGPSKPSRFSLVTFRSQVTKALERFYAAAADVFGDL